MSGKVFAAAVGLAVSALVLAGCGEPAAESEAELANPASVYCEEQGYRIEMRTGEGGTYGVCVFPDGSECDEWAFFRGECAPGAEEAAPTEVPAAPTEVPATPTEVPVTPTDGPVQVPEPALARDLALEYVFDQYGEAVFPPPGGDWTEEDVTAEGLVGASAFSYTADDVVVTVSFPLVNPADTVYAVTVSKEGTGFLWEGEVSADFEVKESSVTEGRHVAFEGISFSHSDALATDAVAEVVQAASEDVPEFAWLPAHIRFSFEGYALAETFHEPRILVFSAEGLSANDTLQAITANIRRMLEEKPGETVGVFEAPAILPPMNAGHMMPSSQVAYLDFQNGTGVRFLTQMGQAFYPINNHDLFYTYQGVTDDGSAYVAAILPISHPSLPEDDSEIPGGDFDAFSEGFETYAAGVAAQLDGEAADSFLPSIELLDEMMKSLTVEEVAAGSAPSEAPVVAWYGYVASTPEGGQYDDYLALSPEGARRAVGIAGIDKVVEAEVVALRDQEEPGKYAHFWGTLVCDVPDYGGCQLRVTKLRVDSPGPFFDADPVVAWEGTIVSGPAGPRSGGDDYLVVLVDGIPIEYGIDSQDGAVAAQIESLRDTGAVVRVWGELAAGVIDWNGTRLLAERVETVVEAPAALEG